MSQKKATASTVEARGKRDKTKNLKPVKTSAEAAERGRAGGIASGKARAERRAMRELLDLCLREPIEGGQTNAEAIVAALVSRARSGDVRAFGMILDTLGERPKQGLDLTNSDGSLAPCHIDFSSLPLPDIMAIVDQVYAKEQDSHV